MKHTGFLFSVLVFSAFAFAQPPYRTGVDQFNQSLWSAYQSRHELTGPFAGLTPDAGGPNVSAPNGSPPTLPEVRAPKPLPLELKNAASLTKTLLEVAHKVRLTAVARPLAVFLADVVQASRVAQAAGLSGSLAWRNVSSATTPLALTMSFWNASTAMLDIGEKMTAKNVASQGVLNGISRLNYLMLMGGQDTTILFQGQHLHRDELVALLRKMHDEAMVEDPSTAKVLGEAGRSLIPFVKNRTELEQNKAAQALIILAHAIQDLNVDLAATVAQSLPARTAARAATRRDAWKRSFDAFEGSHSCKVIVYCRKSTGDGKYANERRDAIVPIRFGIGGNSAEESATKIQLVQDAVQSAQGRGNWGCLPPAKAGWYRSYGDGVVNIASDQRTDLVTKGRDPAPEINKQCAGVPGWTGQVYVAASSYQFAGLDTEPAADPQQRMLQLAALQAYGHEMNITYLKTTEQFDRHLERVAPQVYSGVHALPDQPRMIPRR